MTATDDALRSSVEQQLGAEAVDQLDSGRVIVRPDRVSAISELLRWAARESVVVRTPPRRWLDRRRHFPGSGEVLLTLDRLNGSLTLDRFSSVATVPGGVTGAELAWRLHREGQWVRPRPLPFYGQPLGNYLAGPGLASEMTALSMWESPLMGLEAVLADGRVLRAGVAPRSAAGPDYRAFLLGTGDRIGVITSVTWRTEHRTVPMLFAARLPATGAGLQLFEDHCRFGWRPWSSAILRGAEAATWQSPHRWEGGHEIVLLCHRAEGDRAQLLRSQLGAAVFGLGGEVLEPSAARGWYEGSFLSWCKRGGAAAADASDAPESKVRATAWIAAQWPALAILWQALAGVGGPGSRTVVQAEGFRPEGGMLRVRFLGTSLTAGRLERTRELLAEMAGAEGARIVGFQRTDGEDVEPATERGPAASLLQDLAADFGPVLNPPSRTSGKGS